MLSSPNVKQQPTPIAPRVIADPEKTARIAAEINKKKRSRNRLRLDPLARAGALGLTYRAATPGLNFPVLP